MFGVPTFDLDGEQFWGHDRMEHWPPGPDGRLPDYSARAAALEGRPRGSDRPIAPILKEDGSLSRCLYSYLSATIGSTLRPPAPPAPSSRPGS